MSTVHEHSPYFIVLSNDTILEHVQSDLIGRFYRGDLNISIADIKREVAIFMIKTLAIEIKVGYASHSLPKCVSYITKWYMYFHMFSKKRL